MSTAEIANMIESIGLPYSYYQFDEDTGQQPPFVVFYYPENNDFVADNKNYVNVFQLVIELYTDEKDFSLEADVEKALNDNGLVYSRQETKLDDERMYEVIFTTQVVITEVSTDEQQS